MQGDTKRKTVKVGVGSTIGFGAVLAMVMSWTANKAVLWALLHGLLSWVYVVWYLLTHNDWDWL